MTVCTVRAGDLEQFVRFCSIDPGLTIRPSQRHRQRVSRLPESSGSQITTESIRGFLGSMRGTFA